MAQQPKASNDPSQTMLKALKSFEEKQKVLQELDLFVLDNSLRETTVGQLRGHTLEGKHEIHDLVSNIITVSRH